MGQVGLFLSGAALFLNALVLMGKANDKSAGVFNLFVGTLQVIIPFYLIVISDGSSWVIFQHAAVFLFGLTYLYFGLTIIKGLDPSGLGYFSLWTAIICFIYSAASVIHFNDIIGALTWIMWAVLWGLFYVLNVWKKDISAYTGRVAFVQSWVTLTIPALLSMTEMWDSIPGLSTAWIILQLLCLAFFAVSGLSDIRGR
ncbi:AmiS/UreI family transporter [Peribacillus sp. SCS-26]|uniref:AmiS/UreI family transporter n=1 Tax=Paraperibacillus marinus TaxID=3115295 RepID=UPI003906C28D